MEKTKLSKLFNWRFAVGIMVLFSIAIYFTFANSYSLVVNEKQVPTNQGVPFDRSGVTYLPIEAVVEGMGDKYQWNEAYLTGIVTKKDGTTVTVTAGKTVGKVGSKTVPLTTKTVGKTVVPAGHRAIVVNGHLYVPSDFVKNTLKYPVTIKKSAGKTTVYVGKVPSTTTPTKEQPKNNDTQQKPNNNTTKPSTPTQPKEQPKQETKPKDPFAPPTGWVAPKINTTATADKAKNAQILDQQLGFLNTGGTGAVYNPFKKAYGDTPIKVFLDDQPYDASIQIDFWRSQDVPEYNKIPYIAKELFKFYQVPQVYDIVNKGFTGTNIQSQMNKMLTFGNRQVKITAVGDSAVIFIGKPGVKYDSNWNVIK